MSQKTEHNPVTDMAAGFASFVDKTLRGRENKNLLNSTVAMGALEIGVGDPIGNFGWEPFSAVTNSVQAVDYGKYGIDGLHELWSFNPETFTLFGLNFPDFFAEFAGGVSHITPLYNETVGSSLGLPDLPYGGIAHLAHMGMAIYDTGRTFQDLWNDPALHHNVTKILTHPEMGHTVAHKGVMLTVMGLLHPLGPIVSIGVAYLCGHLVHSFFKLLENNREAFQQMQDVPVLRDVYNATGIKEWSEAREEELVVPTEEDPFSETWNEGKPRNDVDGDKQHAPLIITSDLSLAAG